MEHPWPYSDTDPRALKVWLDVQRRMSPGERSAAALNLSDLAFRMAEAGERITHPEAGEREIFLRAAARRLGRDLMIKVYGWDPDRNEPASTSD